ncbi:MAG: ACP S-malonyltransferase, partial [Victivallales bacterium]|nr:ACP S-malonyltransferase [Victivallales bacterium]
LVARRGELMDQACGETAGAMASVLGGDPEVIREVCGECDIDVANYNCPGQIVISGAAPRVKTAVAELKARGLRKVIPLKVAGAYHSRLMAGAGVRLQPVLDDTVMVVPHTALAQNFTGAVIAGEVAEIRRNLVRQVAGSVRWDDCIRALLGRGGDAVIEFGPGQVLTGLMRRIDSSVPTFNIGTAKQLAAFSVE